jgi:hypothetical protein
MEESNNILYVYLAVQTAMFLIAYNMIPIVNNKMDEYEDDDDSVIIF